MTNEGKGKKQKDQADANPLGPLVVKGLLSAVIQFRGNLPHFMNSLSPQASSITVFVASPVENCSFYVYDGEQFIPN